eukprot:COSAG02_NODE_57755_length_279_cov_1.144444_1_plen_43_part_10
MTDFYILHTMIPTQPVTATAAHFYQYHSNALNPSARLGWIRLV